MRAINLNYFLKHFFLIIILTFSFLFFSGRHAIEQGANEIATRHIYKDFAKPPDHFYYEDGAQSILNFNIEGKFDGKRQPITPSKKISKESLPWYAPYFLVFYPNPTFKFGYSLTMAGISLLVPDQIIENWLPMPILCNLVLSFASIILIYFIALNLFSSAIIAFSSSLFFTLDVLQNHVTYYYQSHTISGLFFILCAYTLFLWNRNKLPSLIRFSLISCLLIFSIMSSSHFVPLAALTGIFILFSVLWSSRKAANKWITWTKYCLFGLLGFSLWPGYILGVEALFSLEKLGVTPYFKQLYGYKYTVDKLIDSYPLHLRFIWDFRLINIYTWQVISCCLAIIFYLFLKKHKLFFTWIKSTGLNKLLNKNSTAIFVFPYIGMLLICLIYTQPLGRALFPFTIIIYLFMGTLCGIALNQKGYLIKIFALFLLFFNIANNLYMTGFLTYKNEISGKALVPLDSPYTEYGFSKNYFMRDYTIETFVNKLFEKKLDDETLITFDPFDIVMAYASHRRFVKGFLVDPSKVVDRDVIENDFKAILNICELIEKKDLGKGQLVRVKKKLWNIAIWEQENHYIYGYMGEIKKFLGGSLLKDLDYRSIYYVKLGHLKKALTKPTQTDV